MTAPQLDLAPDKEIDIEAPLPAKDDESPFQAGKCVEGHQRQREGRDREWHHRQGEGSGGPEQRCRAIEEFKYSIKCARSN